MQTYLVKILHKFEPEFFTKNVRRETAFSPIATDFPRRAWYDSLVLQVEESEVPEFP